MSPWKLAYTFHFTHSTVSVGLKAAFTQDFPVSSLIFGPIYLTLDWSDPKINVGYSGHVKPVYDDDDDDDDDREWIAAHTHACTWLCVAL